MGNIREQSHAFSRVSQNIFSSAAKSFLLSRWVSGSEDKKFKIVNPDLLAETWGTMKGTPGMHWSKIKKVMFYVELYLKIVSRF